MGGAEGRTRRLRTRDAAVEAHATTSLRKRWMDLQHLRRTIGKLAGFEAPQDTGSDADPILTEESRVRKTRRPTRRSPPSSPRVQTWLPEGLRSRSSSLSSDGSRDTETSRTSASSSRLSSQTRGTSANPTDNRFWTNALLNGKYQ